MTEPTEPTEPIRDARDEDADAVAEIFAHYVRTTATTFETEPRPPDEWRATWAALREQGWPVLVAEVDRRIVGFAYVGPWRTKPAYRHTVETTVYLAQAARGRGLGAKLATQAHERAAAAGAREVIAVIADSGDGASLALHRRLGFHEVGTLSGVGYKFGRWINVQLLQKSLRD